MTAEAAARLFENEDIGYSWSTFPEQLEKAGISWKIYQDQGLGLDAEHNWGWDQANPYAGNYGCNSLLLFDQYQQAELGTPLSKKAGTGTNISAGGSLFDHFSQDILAQQPPPGILDCHSRGLQRAPELAGKLRRLVRLADP